MMVAGDQIDYAYDEDGNLYGFYYNGIPYIYLRNGQNDITGILDSSGNLVVSYEYDSWGKVLSVTGSMASTIGERNPFRYRGYYYDTETGLFYVGSRYYDSVTGRFLNVDGQLNSLDGMMGFNMFAYCVNNPVNFSDPCGTCLHHWKFWKDCATCKRLKSGNVSSSIPLKMKINLSFGMATEDIVLTGSSIALGSTAVAAIGASIAVSTPVASPVVTGNTAKAVGTVSRASSYGVETSEGAVETISVGNSEVQKVTPRFNANQNAVIQLAKENRKGISMSNAKILEEWGDEYGVRAEIHMGHPNRPSIVSQNPHFHFGNGSDHVPIFPN